MALNMTHKYTKTEVWPVTAEIDSGVAIVSSTGQPAVSLTGSGGFTKTSSFGPYDISGIPAGGVGLQDLQVTVAIDGAFRFPVAGASAATDRNVLVYRITASGLLSLTATAAVPFGKIDRFIGEASATEASVWIGDFS